MLLREFLFTEFVLLYLCGITITDEKVENDKMLLDFENLLRQHWSPEVGVTLGDTETWDRERTKQIKSI